MRELIGFPQVVNEKAARAVAAIVATLSLIVIVTGATWLLAPLFAGFALRVISGPTLSPIGRLASQVIAPRLGAARMVPGAPKQFAQGIGAAVTGIAGVLALLGQSTAALWLVGVLLVCATLEAVLGFCLGCWLYGQLARRGIISGDECVECADISLRGQRAAS